MVSRPEAALAVRPIPASRGDRRVETYPRGIKLRKAGALGQTARFLRCLPPKCVTADGTDEGMWLAFIQDDGIAADTLAAQYEHVGRYARPGRRPQVALRSNSCFLPAK